MKQTPWAIASVVCYLALSTIASAQKPIDATEFDKLHALIKPREDETAWERLPWMTDLWEARKRAAAEGKPVLLWERDGHPLGCV